MPLNIRYLVCGLRLKNKRAEFCKTLPTERKIKTEIVQIYGDLSECPVPQKYKFKIEYLLLLGSRHCSINFPPVVHPKTGFKPSTLAYGQDWCGGITLTFLDAILESDQVCRIHYVEAVAGRLVSHRVRSNSSTRLKRTSR